MRVNNQRLLKGIGTGDDSDMYDIQGVGNVKACRYGYIDNVRRIEVKSLLDRHLIR